MRAPDLTVGENGAWFLQKANGNWGAVVSCWFVKLKYYHPMLEWFVVLMSHLREAPGAPKANKFQTSSTHEIVISAIDPEEFLFTPFDPDKLNFKLMYPIEIVHQLNNQSDDNAKLIALLAVEELLEERLDPISDQFHAWLKLFNEWSASNPVVVGG